MSRSDGPVGQPVELPIELEDVMEQLSLVNRLYAEAAATGSRNSCARRWRSTRR